MRVRTPIAVSSEQLGTLVFAQLSIPEGVLGDEEGILKEKHVRLFNDELRRLGYRVPETSSSVFKENELPDTDYLLAGRLSEFECSQEQHGTCALTIQWELLHRDSDEVVYRMTARHEETEFRGQTDAAKRILLGGLHSLLSRPKFVDALKGTSAVAERTAKTQVAIARCAANNLPLPKHARTAIAATALIESGNDAGSAVFVSADGFLLTAAHVVTRDVVKVTLSDHEQVDAQVLRISEQHDVALLRLVTRRQTACLPVQSALPEIGENIFAIGSPGGEKLSFSVSRGIVSGRRTLGGTDYLQTDAALNPGNSGGPLLGDDGKVYAIASWKIGGETAEGLGFGVPVDVALRALGVHFGERSDEIAPDLQRSTVRASAVTDVEDPHWYLVGDGAAGKTPPWVRRMRRWGWGGIYAGVGVLAIGAFQALASDDSYDAVHPANLLGWGLCATGVGLVLTSRFFRPASRPDQAHTAESRVRFTARVGLSQLSVQGTF